MCGAREYCSRTKSKWGKAVSISGSLLFWGVLSWVSTAWKLRFNADTTLVPHRSRISIDYQAVRHLAALFPLFGDSSSMRCSTWSNE